MNVAMCVLCMQTSAGVAMQERWEFLNGRLCFWCTLLHSTTWPSRTTKSSASRCNATTPDV